MNSYQTPVSDGGTVNHNNGLDPHWYWAISELAGEFCSVTAHDRLTLTLAIKKHDGTAGTAGQKIAFGAGYC